VRKFGIGDRVRYGRTAGTITEILPDLGQIRIKTDAGQGLRVNAGSVQHEDEPAHKMVEGPRRPRR
jgi:hypothetical protein